jgi:hypothetical protein
MRDARMRSGAPKGARGTLRLSLPGLPPVSRIWRHEMCRIGLARDGVAVLRINGGRGDKVVLAGAGIGAGAASSADSVAGDGANAAASRKLTVVSPTLAERSLRGMVAQASPDELAAAIGDALDEARCGGLPIHATFGDDLVRYFIVTPPPNGTRVQDLRTAAEVRFQMLYGESAAAWQLVADWQAATPFLACAVPLRLHTALQLAARARRSCLVSTSPNFVGAWNRWRRRVAGDAWLATLHDGALTLGVVDGAGRRARLAAVRTLALIDDAPPLAWLNEQLMRTALLDNVAAPKVLHVYGALPPAWQPTQHAGTPSGKGGTGANAGDAIIEVRACSAAQAAFALPQGAHASWSAAAQLVLSSRDGASR